MAELNDGVKPDTSTDNYDTWSWKQIKVAICGGVDMSATQEADMRDGVSNPTTLRDASIYFSGTQTTLESVQIGLESLQKSVKDTWKGKGSEAFQKMLDRQKSAVDTMVDAITGVGGEPNYSQTFDWAATSLVTSINNIESWDHWAAQKTMWKWVKEECWYADGVYYPKDPFAKPPWHTEADGTVIVAVSTYPEIVDEMTKHMRSTINDLAKHYRRYVADLRDPGNAAADPGGGVPDTPDPVKIDIPPIKIDTPDIKPPKLGDGVKPPGLPGGPGGGPPKLTPPGGLDGGGPPKLTAPGGLKPPDGLKPPGGIDAPKLPGNDLLAGKPPGAGGPGDLPPINVPHLQVPDGSQLPPLHHVPLPDPSKFDPLTHLSGTNSPNLSQFAPGLRLPGSGDLHDPASLAAGLRSPDSTGVRLSPGGTALPGAGFGLPGRLS
ncbi:MAG: WXG100 family type VII secretion target, partial [Catenulispora sp.]